METAIPPCSVSARCTEHSVLSRIGTSGPVYIRYVRYREKIERPSTSANNSLRVKWRVMTIRDHYGNWKFFDHAYTLRRRGRRLPSVENLVQGPSSVWTSYTAFFYPRIGFLASLLFTDPLFRLCV